nr:MAG TPA: hypothetical protein [Caudoviricetes sp.]
MSFPCDNNIIAQMKGRCKILFYCQIERSMI